jgi:hypothetical protein
MGLARGARIGVFARQCRCAGATGSAGTKMKQPRPSKKNWRAVQRDQANAMQARRVGATDGVRRTTRPSNTTKATTTTKGGCYAATLQGAGEIRGTRADQEPGRSTDVGAQRAGLEGAGMVPGCCGRAGWHECFDVKGTDTNNKSGADNLRCMRGLTEGYVDVKEAGGEGDGDSSTFSW